LNFSHFKHLKEQGHSYGDADKLDPILLHKVDCLWDYLDTPLIVTSGYRQGDNGWHGRGKAIDIMCPVICRQPGGLFKFWQAAERLNFNGIGVYTTYALNRGKPNEEVLGGLHCDTRDLPAERPVGARWLRVANLNLPGGYEDLALSLENLRKHGVI
jgi:hypothetical protein